MDSDVGRDDNGEITYCADDDEYRIFCKIWDNPVVETTHKNHLKLGLDFYKYFS